MEIENAIVKDNQVAPNSKQVNNNNKPNNNNNADKKIIINVPQGCYAIVNEKTVESIAGLATEGLGPCSCLIITDEDRENFALMHVDGYTMNLWDKQLGLISTIRQLKRYAKNKRLKIYCTSGYWLGIPSRVDYQQWIYDIIDTYRIQEVRKEDVKMQITDSEMAGLILRKGENINISQNNNIIMQDNPNILFCKETNGFELVEYLKHFYKIQYCYGIAYWRNNCSETETVDSAKEQITMLGQYKKLKYEIAIKRANDERSMQEHNIQFNHIDGDEIMEATFQFPPICCFRENFLYEGGSKYMIDALYLYHIRIYKIILFKQLDNRRHTTMLEKFIDFTRHENALNEEERTNEIRQLMMENNKNLNTEYEISLHSYYK